MFTVMEMITQALKDKPDKFKTLSAKFSCDANNKNQLHLQHLHYLVQHKIKEMFIVMEMITQALKDKPDKFKTLSAKFSCDANKCKLKRRF